MQKGYNSNFIGDGIKIKLPTFNASLGHSVLRKPGVLRDDIYADHIHFTLVMNEHTRQLIYSAYNIDQSLLKPKVLGEGKKSWRKDRKFGKDVQLGNEYYADRKTATGDKIPNPYDKGHMVMRSNNMWGKTDAASNAAGRDTFNYANASLQHMNLNRDEWKELELKVVRTFTHSRNRRLSVFTGPIYGDIDRHVHLSDTDNARIPCGFFKVLCYRTKHEDVDKQLGVLAFAIFQDPSVLRDKRGPTIKTDRRYQLTITELQHLTGINFDPKLVARNPLFYTPNEVRDRDLGIPRTPEIIPIEDDENIIRDPDDERCNITPLCERPIIINAAMINPSGNERTGEWVSLFNRSSRKKTLKNWKLLDCKGRETLVNISIEAGEAVRLKGTKLGKIRLGNQGGSVMLYDQHGCIMDHVSWGRNDVRRNGEGLAYLFEHGG
jgi:endonuclease G